MHHKSIHRATALIAVALLSGCSGHSAPDPPAAAASVSTVTLTAAQRQHVQLQTVEPARYRRSIETTGVVDFDNDQATGVLAPLSGPVTRLLVAPGDRVRKGEPLATVNSPDFAAAVGAYRKALASSRTNRRLADLDKDLAQHEGVSQREAAQAQTDAVNAEADRDAALQSLIALGIPAATIEDIQEGRDGRMEGMIRAPIAGTVVERLITPGELLQAGTTPCFTVADLSRVWVMAHVFGPDLASVSLGDTAEIITGIGTKTFPGKVDNIAAQVDPDTRSVAVRVTVANPGDVLKKQMYVRVRITAQQERTGLLVPVSAVLRDNENLPFIYQVRSDGSYTRAHVTLGSRIGDRYEIADGLRAGSQIVIDGGLFVQFMQSQ